MTRRFASLAAVVFAANSACFAGAIFTGTDEGTQTHVKAFDTPSLGTIASYFPYTGFSGGVRVAAGDVNGDGRADLVAGTGVGGGGVRVFDAITNDTLRDFAPFPGFAGGVYVAAGDVNGDGRADVVVGTDAGPTGLVRVFDGLTNDIIQTFEPYAGFTGGVRVATGDLDGDGKAEIITGTGVGASHVKAFNGVTPDLIHSFFAYQGFNGGIFVAGATPVPEPGTLLALTSLGLFLRRRPSAK